MNCSTPANYFHVLRRQISLPFRKPVSGQLPCLQITVSHLNSGFCFYIDILLSRRWTSVRNLNACKLFGARFGFLVSFPFMCSNTWHAFLITDSRDSIARMGCVYKFYCLWTQMLELGKHICLHRQCYLLLTWLSFVSDLHRHVFAPVQTPGVDVVSLHLMICTGMVQSTLQLEQLYNVH